MITFNATLDQLKQMAANVCNASTPMGLGFLHFNEESNFSPSDFQLMNDGGIFLDYVEGRMVKLRVHKDGDNWKLSEPREDYQSWAQKYPTAKDLVLSVGGEVTSEAKEDY